MRRLFDTLELNIAAALLAECFGERWEEGWENLQDESSSRWNVTWETTVFHC